jgi:hypothetical protein
MLGTGRGLGSGPKARKHRCSCLVLRDLFSAHSLEALVSLTAAPSAPAPWTSPDEAPWWVNPEGTASHQSLYQANYSYPLQPVPQPCAWACCLSCLLSQGPLSFLFNLRVTSSLVI